jgi:hypothetical protein
VNEVPSVGAPGTGIGTAAYTVLTIGALFQKTFKKAHRRLGNDLASVTIPVWLFSQNNSQQRTLLSERNASTLDPHIANMRVSD